MTSLQNPPSRLLLGSMLLTEIQAPSVGLCYVIGRSATRSKKSSIIHLVYKPFVLSPNWSLTTPLRLTLHYISSDKGIFWTILYRESLVCNSCANLAHRSQQHYKRSRSGYHSMHGTRHRCSYRWRCASIIFGLTQYIFINEFWFYRAHMNIFRYRYTL